MPRLTTAVPSYRRHKASGQAVVTLGGRDHYLGAWNSAESKRLYQSVVQEWLSAGRVDPPDDRGTIAVCELLLAYLREAQAIFRQNGRESSHFHNIRDAIAPLRELYGRLPVREFGPLKLKAVRDVLITRRLSRSTVNKHVGTIKRVFRWGVENELVPPEISHGLQAVAGLRRGRSVARESEPVRPVREDTLAATLCHLSAQVRAMIQLQLLTGARPGEICSMRGCDIDTGEKLWIYRPHSHKTEHWGHERVIYLGPKARAIVEQYLKPNPQSHLFSPADAERARRQELSRRRKTPLSCGNRPGSNRKRNAKEVGNCYTVASYRRAIGRACDAAFAMPAELREPQQKAEREAEGALPAAERERRQRERRDARSRWRREHSWHPHQLRHNAGTQLRREYGLEAAQVILGHKTLAVTEIYAEKNVAAAQKIMAEVG